MPPDDIASAEDMLVSARLVVEFVRDSAREDFPRDIKTQSAVLHRLLLVGEASRRISDEFKGLHPEIRWREMSGMRNKLIHEYDVVDIDEVWRTATVDIPDLIGRLETIVPLET